MKREEILDKAKDAVCNDRENEYGSPEYNFGVIADLWTAYKGVDFSEKDVAMMMALLKIARIKTGRFVRDNYVDLAGYAACGGEFEDTNSIAADIHKWDSLVESPMPAPELFGKEKN